MYKNERGQHYWTDDELDSIAISVIEKAVALKEAHRRGSVSQDNELPTTISLEFVREGLESETNYLSLLPLDLAIHRVAQFDEDRGGIVGLNQKTQDRFKNLQDSKKLAK